MRTAFTVPFHCFVGTIITLTSTFVGERSIFVAYPEIMGCEDGCVVVATGWPLIFVTDYLGMSVVNTADILEVWFAADRFSWVPFLVNVGAWTGISLGIACVFRWRKDRRPRHP